MQTLFIQSIFAVSKKETWICLFCSTNASFPKQPRCNPNKEHNDNCWRISHISHNVHWFISFCFPSSVKRHLFVWPIIVLVVVGIVRWLRFHNAFSQIMCLQLLSTGKRKTYKLVRTRSKRTKRPQQNFQVSRCDISNDAAFQSPLSTSAAAGEACRKVLSIPIHQQNVYIPDSIETLGATEGFCRGCRI